MSAHAARAIAVAAISIFFALASLEAPAAVGRTEMAYGVSPGGTPYRTEPLTKFESRYYYRYRTASDQQWGAPVPMYGD